LLDGLPKAVLRLLAAVARRALGHGPRATLKPSR
jgi:hypothetical protein